MNHQKNTRQMQPETKARWNVAKPNSIPSFGLDKRVKKVNAPAIAVSKRIDEHLRLKSIVTEFDSVNGVATCKTRDFLHFQIFLYAGPEGSTYVEVMRIKGCGLSFMKERENIINAAEQKVGQEQEESKYFASNLLVPSTFLDLYVPPSQEDLEHILVRASDKLHSNNQEDVIFVLENLSSLTTVNRLAPNNSHQMSFLVMQHKSNVRDMILSIYNHANESSMEDSDEMSERIRIACLSILTNGITSILDKNQRNLLDYEYEDFIKCLVPSLVKAAANYKNSMETACIAISCLCTLMINSSVSREQVKDADMLIIAKEAQLYGYREHLRLEQDASAMVKALHTRPSKETHPA